MARIRRIAGEAERKRHPVWYIGAYIRLSRDDGGDESLSITNQRKIILEFIGDRFDSEEHQLVDFYVDDGRSGTTEEARPAFRRMTADIEAGRINCVICKTLSRCFRNYSDQGRFLEQFLPACRCRFIAISSPSVDTYADPECTQSMEIPINGLMNDRYAAKTSADVRRTLDTKRRRGEFIGAFAPYGYRKAPDNRNALVIDEGAAPVVRDIFAWFVREGMNMGAIARRLNGLGIPNPAAYKAGQGLAYRSSSGQGGDGLWSQKTVRDILRHPVYAGAMLQGRQAVVSYKVHKRYATDPADWYLVEHTHQPVIGQALFDRAQALLQRDTRTAPGRQRLYLFSGLLRCGDCKRSMVRNPSRNYVYYYCRTYREKSRERCTKHAIRADILEGVVLAAVQMQIALAEGLDRLAAEIEAAPFSGQTLRLEELKEQKSRELGKTSKLLDSLYLDRRAGELSEERYRRLKERLEGQSNRLQEELACIREEERRQEDSDPCLRDFLSLRSVRSLTRGLLVELVRFIHIQEGGGIEIEFSYADPCRSIAERAEDAQVGF